MNRTARILRLLLPGGNPLSRGTDRLRGALLIVVIAAELVLVPVMLTYGSLTHTAFVDRAAQQAKDWHRTAAVVTEDAPATTYAFRGAPASTSVHVMAEWRMPDGSTGTGRVRVEEGVRAGTQVTIWLDELGNPVEPPADPSEAAAAAVLVVVFGWLAAAGLLTLAYVGAARLIDRRTCRSWEREWARVEPAWRNQPR